jgi:hypothetical protein
MFPKSRTKWIVLGVVLAGVVMTLGAVGVCLALLRSQTEPAAPSTVSADKPSDAAKDKRTDQGTGHTPPDTMLELAMKRLHEEAVARFLSRPGNGMGRMMIGLPVLVKTEWKDPVFSPGELAEPKRVDVLPDLMKIHQDSLRDFQDSKTNRELNAVRLIVRPREPGLLQDEMKLLEKDWEIKTLDLVGLVKHDHPVVYVSDKLPKMKELAQVPTRHLDFFEQAGLEHFAKNNEPFLRTQDGTTRMLGAIRASGDCLKCHDGKAGTVLGAFSYTLRPARYEEPASSRWEGFEPPIPFRGDR